MTAVQDSVTSILVSWTPPSGATGYMIHYDSSGGHSGSESVSSGSTDHYQLIGLQNGHNYTISIVATTENLSSIPVELVVTMSKAETNGSLSILQCMSIHKFLPVPAPGQVLVSVSSITASSISLSWSVASGRVVSWEVVWRPTDRGTESTSGSLPGNTYTIHHLDSSTIYTVTVTATNVAGTTDSTPILFSTGILLAT